MNYTINIERITTKEELANSWSQADYLELLEQFGFSEAEGTLEEMKELLYMAIAEFEPNEAAAILLNYRLSDALTEGQIDQLSHEMQEDEVAEEYPDISLHKSLFEVNQLLYKAYNGKFPCSKATIIVFDMKPKNETEQTRLTKELVLKGLVAGMSDRNVIKRLFGAQLNKDISFPEADDILWEFNTLGKDRYEVITSEYWMDKEEFNTSIFQVNILDSVKAE